MSGRDGGPHEAGRGGGGNPFGPGSPPKPGVVPLRPLAVGEILDGAVSYIRTHPKVVLGASAVVAVIGQILSSVFSALFLDDVLRSPGFRPGAVPTATDLRSITGPVIGGGLLVFVVSAVLSVVLTGLLIVVIGRAILGQPANGLECLRSVWRRIPALILVSLLQLLTVVLGVIVAIIPLSLAAGLAAVLVGPGAAVIVAMLLLAPLAVAVYTPFCIAAPALVLEGVGVLAALRRSVALVRSRYWAVFAVVLLTVAIYTVLTLIVAAASGLIVAGVSGPRLTPDGAGSFASIVLSGVLEALRSTLLAPFVAGVTGLLYVDQRMRREGFDIELQRASAGGPR